MRDIDKEVLELLRENIDEEYKKFNAKLIPTAPLDYFIGVRTPVQKQIAKQIVKDGKGLDYIQKLPHKYYEEYNIHSFIIGSLKDYDKIIYELDRWLPYVNNWATCDSATPKFLQKHTDELYLKILEWISSDHEYTVRYAILLLMNLYLDNAFNPSHLELVGSIVSDKYYINMMIAWYFATAVVKQEEKAVDYIKSQKLPKWVQNKAIQKAFESLRVSDELKLELRKYKL